MLGERLHPTFWEKLVPLANILKTPICTQYLVKMILTVRNKGQNVKCCATFSAKTFLCLKLWKRSKSLENSCQINPMTDRLKCEKPLEKFYIKNTIEYQC